MSDIIQLLPEHIANQIAAGEVVQRPASVVKELLENALDAGAEQIRLVVKDAGKTLIQVIDDGIGMSETDARMSFERHATSKIRKTEDLFNLYTMGFRGEALASIAAVAQVELRTRKREQDLGILIQNEGSQIVNQEPCQTAIGTSIAVKNLFFNIPARRNFLKSNQIEMQHITQEFERIAIANPQVFFSLHHNNEQIFHLPKSNLRQRIVGVLGNKLNQGLIPIGEHTDALKISGFVSKPEFAKKTRGEQFFFVNNRFIKSSYLNHAVMLAYEDLLPQGMHPLYVIFLEIDPKRIDINVHPTKQEIKFEDEKLIYNYLRVTTRHALAQYNITPSLDFDHDLALHEQYAQGIIDTENEQLSKSILDLDKDDKQDNNSNNPIQDNATISALHTFIADNTNQENNHSEEEDQSIRAAFLALQQPKNNAQPLFPKKDNDTNKTYKPTSSNYKEYTKQTSPLQENNLRNWQNLYESVGNANVQPATPQDTEGEKVESLISSIPIDENATQSAEQKQPYQLHQRYIISPIRSGFMLIDQNAAHQRILYEEYLHAFAQKEMSSQQKLFPTAIELTVSQALVLEEMLPLLTAFGIELKKESVNTFLVYGLPTPLANVNEAQLINSLLEQYTNQMPSLQVQAYEKIAYAMAQKSALGVKRLEVSEMQQIIDQLFACQAPHQAPNGQKTFIIINNEEIKRRFA